MADLLVALMVASLADYSAALKVELWVAQKAAWMVDSLVVLMVASSADYSAALKVDLWVAQKAA